MKQSVSPNCEMQLTQSCLAYPSIAPYRANSLIQAFCRSLEVSCAKLSSNLASTAFIVPAFDFCPELIVASCTSSFKSSCILPCVVEGLSIIHTLVVAQECCVNSDFHSAMAEHRFSPITTDDHAGLLWITAILCLIYSFIAFMVRGHVKWKLYGVDDAFLAAATVYEIYSYLLEEVLINSC